MHSKVHSMRVCFVRPRNFPAISIFFPPCQDLLCEAAGISYQRTDNVSLTKRSHRAGLTNYRLGVFIVKGLLCEIQARFTVLKIYFFSFTFIAVVSSQSCMVLLIRLSSATNSVHSHDDIKC